MWFAVAIIGVIGIASGITLLPGSATTPPPPASESIHPQPSTTPPPGTQGSTQH
jgi:hypothetical protein